MSLSTTSLTTRLSCTSTKCASSVLQICVIVVNDWRLLGSFHSIAHDEAESTAAVLVACERSSLALPNACLLQPQHLNHYHASLLHRFSPPLTYAQIGRLSTRSVFGAVQIVARARKQREMPRRTAVTVVAYLLPLHVPWRTSATMLSTAVLMTELGFSAWIAL
jgi:hypothetical protein